MWNRVLLCIIHPTTRFDTYVRLMYELWQLIITPHSELAPVQIEPITACSVGVFTHRQRFNTSTNKTEFKFKHQNITLDLGVILVLEQTMSFYQSSQSYHTHSLHHTATATGCKFLILIEEFALFKKSLSNGCVGVMLNFFPPT